MDNSKACDKIELSYVLIVEDDAALARLSARYLRRQGFEAAVAGTCERARAMFRERKPDLFILDVELPDGDGFSLCNEIRGETDTPVIFLTGMSETKDKVTGLETGGDYYLTKPFERGELLAVIKNLLKKAARNNENIVNTLIVKKGPLTLNLSEGKAYMRGRDADLTQKEFAVLLTLARADGIEMTGEEIYKSVWGSEMGIDSGLIRKYISQIKRKIGEDGADEFSIVTGYGKGYAFICE